MEYWLDSFPITITVIRKANKNLYMRFYDSKTLVVTCNSRISEKKILLLVEKNKASLLKMLKAKQKEEEKSHSFWYLGKEYIPVYDKNQKEVSFDQNFIYCKDETMLHKFYWKECFRVFDNEVKRILPAFENIPFFTLKIRQMKTRWGVNNLGSMTITLNSELLKKDLDLLDYVIIHELCHFYEPNHSSRFWDHVEQYYPKYKEARKRLRS